MSRTRIQTFREARAIFAALAQILFPSRPRFNQAVWA